MNSDFMIARIAAEFPLEPVPVKEKVLDEGVYLGHPECEEIREFFGGRSWQAITPQDVFRFRSELPLFSPSALAYYIAAWMSCSLACPKEVDTAVEDLVCTLARADPNLWTQKQRFVICEWLHHFEEVPMKERLQTALANLGCDEKRLGP